MTIEGYGPYQIASKLKEEKILIPSAYLAQHGEGVNKTRLSKMCTAGVLPPSATFLKSVNIWDTPSTSRPESTSRTRKAIMSRRTNGRFSRIPMSLSLTSRPLTLCRKSEGMSDATRTAGAEAAPLTGLLYCADCGGKICPPHQQRQAYLNIPAHSTAKSVGTLQYQ